MSLRERATASRPSSSRYAGRVAGAFGLSGELKCDPTSAGRSVFVPGATLRCERKAEAFDVRVEGVREHGARLLLRFKDVADANAAQSFAGSRLYAPRKAFVLDEGEYLDEDLVGCELIDERGHQLARVDSVEHYAQDLLVCGTARIPMVKAFIRDVNIREKKIRVSLPSGLLDETKAYQA